MKIYFLPLLLLCFSCSRSDSAVSPKDINNKLSSGLRLAWDYSSMQQLAPEGGYARMRRLSDGSLIAVYDCKGNSAFIRSYDNGTSWTEPELVFEHFEYTKDGVSTFVNIANSEVYELKDGTLIFGCNYRPEKAEITPYSIAVRRIKNEKWEDIQVIYNAAPRFIDGCWEPAFIQLPSGTLQVYFANENPYQASSEQEISMMESPDNGVSWGEAKTICFRKDHRDGMPVPQLVNNEIVVSIEDNLRDQFKPYTVRTKIEDNWKNPVLTNSTEREYALVSPVNDNYYLGAPYLLILPSGVSLMSYQTNEGRARQWELSEPEVVVGNAEARNFKNPSRPFRIPLNKQGLWNSLMHWNADTIALLTSSNFNGESVAPWLIKGYLIPEVNIEKAKPIHYPIFLGAQGETKLRAGIGKDRDYLYFSIVVNDNSIYSGKVQDGVGIELIWKSGSFMVLYNHKGEILENNIQGISCVAAVTSTGYTLDIRLPLTNIPFVFDELSNLKLTLSAYNTSGIGYKEISDPITIQAINP